MTAVAEPRGTDAPRYLEGHDVPRAKKPSLSPRDMDLLRGVRAGKKYADIAHDIGVGFETVKCYMSRLRAKLGVDTKVGLALWAERNLKD